MPQHAATKEEGTEDDRVTRHGDQVHIDEWAAPDVCDDRGFLRAGKILEWMDVAGPLAASRYARLPAVTVAVDGCRLLKSVPVGSRVTLHARVAHTTRRTVGVALSMTACASGRRAAHHAVSGYMTFVVLDREGKAAAVPNFNPQIAEDVALQREGQMRRQFRDELGAKQQAALHPSTQMSGGPRQESSGSPVVHLLRELGDRLSGRRPTTATRSAQLSYVHRIEPVRAGKLNFNGTLYGGTLMRWLETCSAMSAEAFLDSPVRLVAVHGLQFLRPVLPSVFVHMHAIVVHTDRAEATIRIVARSEDPLTWKSHDNLTGFLTYAPVGRRVAIPRVVRTHQAEADHFMEAALRKELHARIETMHRDRRRR